MRLAIFQMRIPCMVNMGSSQFPAVLLHDFPTRNIWIQGSVIQIFGALAEVNQQQGGKDSTEKKAGE